MTSMFWGLKLEPGKRYSTTVDKSFHISMATLDASSVNSEKEVVSVALEEGGQGSMFLLTNLRSKDALSSSLDLNFMTGDRITLFCKGQGIVHLSGYMVLDDDDELSGTMVDDEAEEEEEEDEDEDVEDEGDNIFLSKAMKVLQNAKGKASSTAANPKRKLEVEANNKAKKKKIELPPAGKEADSEEESGDGDTDDLNDLLADEEDSDADEEEEDDEEGDDDEEDEEEEEEEEQIKPLKKQNKNQQQQQNQKDKSPGKEQQGKKQQQKQTTPKAVNGVASPGQKQPQSGKKDEKKKNAPSPIKEQNQQNQKTPETGLTGGVKVKDIKIGNGPICKNGKLAVVYYTGRLKSNGKVFDSVMQGSGFKFKVGLGEVIKGWDIGVAGMKVGGKRIITCPPQVAYGMKGCPPQIPSNSTLVFEVELKGVN